MAIPTLSTAGGDQFDMGNPGQVADAEKTPIRSLVNMNATAIDFGVAVAVDVSTVDNGCRPWAADADKFAGISVRTGPFGTASTDGLNTVNYPTTSSVPLLRDGVIFVQAAEAVRADDQALILLAGGAGNGTAGAIGGSKGGLAGTGRVAFPGMDAVWLDATASGAIGRIQVKSNAGVRTTT